jgi:predicted PurR-regulated permease PerM
MPIVGKFIDEYWHLLATNHDEFVTLEKNLFEPIKNFLLAGGVLLGQGVLQMSLAAFVSFFLYRHGVVLMNFLNVAMARLIGTYAANVLDNINNTIKGVTYSLLGTALAQSSLAIIGFSIAGVPEALLLGVLTFMLSLLPIGPPLIWGGATIWLFYQGSAGWGVFVLLWGIFLISGVDNVLKPFLISRSSNTPIILVLFGVMGGVITFGFVGIFIGPTLLAVAFRLIHDWGARALVRSLPPA